MRQPSHTEDSDTLTRILFERYTLSQADVARVWNHVVKLTWTQSSEDKAAHMLYNRHIKGYGASVKKKAIHAAIYDRDNPSKDELEERELNRARIARDAEDAMATLGIVIQARPASHERDTTNTGTKRKRNEEQSVPAEAQQHDADVLDAQEANTSKRHAVDREDLVKDITAAYKDRTAWIDKAAEFSLTQQRSAPALSKHTSGYINSIRRPSSNQISTTHSPQTSIAMDQASDAGPSRVQQAKSHALQAESEISDRLHFTTRQDRLDMVHAHHLQLSDGHTFFDGPHVIPHNHPIYLLGGKALRVVFGEGDKTGLYDVMMCRFELCSYCQHFIQNKPGEPPTTQETNNLQAGADILHGRPFVHTTDCENISQRPNYSELQFQGTRKDVLEGFPRLRDPNLPKSVVSFKVGRNGWKKVEAEMCGQCAHCPKKEYRATSRYGPGFYESFGRPNR